MTRLSTCSQQVSPVVVCTSNRSAWSFAQCTAATHGSTNASHVREHATGPAVHSRSTTKSKRQRKTPLHLLPGSTEPTTPTTNTAHRSTSHDAREHTTLHHVLAPQNHVTAQHIIVRTAHHSATLQNALHHSCARYSTSTKTVRQLTAAFTTQEWEVVARQKKPTTTGGRRQSTLTLAMP